MADDMVPAWMVETARHDERLKAQEKAMAVELATQREAITKRDAATEKRFEGVNEFRAALADQTATFVTRSDLNAAVMRAVAIVTVTFTIIGGIIGAVAFVLANK